LCKNIFIPLLQKKSRFPEEYQARPQILRTRLLMVIFSFMNWNLSHQNIVCGNKAHSFWHRFGLAPPREFFVVIFTELLSDEICPDMRFNILNMTIFFAALIFVSPHNLFVRRKSLLCVRLDLFFIWSSSLRFKVNFRLDALSHCRQRSFYCYWRWFSLLLL
jgi:hypothetical protein